jgi:tellurium resistance protein TerZ
MGVSLEKGTKLDLSKAAADAGKQLKTLVAGAGWDMKGDKEIDLDLIGVKLGADGKAIADANNSGSNYDEAVNFYKNLNTKGAVHSGDNLTGEGDGDDETITYTLADLEAEVKEVAIVVASFSGETFDQVENIKVRMVNADGDEELAAYTNSDLGSGKAVEVGRIKRGDNDAWTFEAVGKLLSEADGKDGGALVKAILESYGVTGL